MVPMAKDHQIAVRVNDPTYEAIESFAEKHDYTKAEAARRMIEDRLAGEGHLESGRAVPDGGQILDRINAVEQQQTQRLDEIEKEIEDVAGDEPSRSEKMLDQINLWSFGFLFAGSLVLGLTQFGLVSVDYSLAAIFTIISGIIYLASDALGGSFKQ